MLHVLQTSFVGKSCVYMECQRLLFGPRCQVPKLLLEDAMRQARNQALVLFGIPSTNRRPNGGHEPDAIYPPTRVDKEEHQGVRRVLTHRCVRLQSSSTLYYRQVPLRGCLRIQPIVPIGHSTSSTSRMHKHGCKCTGKLSQ